MTTHAPGRHAVRIAQRIALHLALLAVAYPLLVAQTPAPPRTVRMQSKILGELRTLHINLPPNYRIAKQRYQVTYVLDGQVKPFFDLAVAAAGYSLSGDPRDFAMPPQIIVGIEQKNRGDDLARNDERVTRYVVDEVIPYIEREYRTLPYRTLIGHSLAGRFALLTLCRAPTIFPAIIAISPSVSDSTTLDTVQRCARTQFTTAPRVRQLVLSAGDKETRLRDGVRHLFAFLNDSAPSMWRVRLVDGTGLGHTDTPFATIPAGLRFTQERALWEMPIAAADSMLNRVGDPSSILNAWLDLLSARVGYRVPASSKWMEVIARTRLARDGAAAATVAAQAMIDAYPENIVGYGLLADAQIKGLDLPAARKTITDALQMLDRVDVFDESARDAQRESLRASLAALGRP